jgi:hypothetical protein
MSGLRRPCPAPAPLRGFAARGDLMPHGASIADSRYLAAIYAGKTLKARVVCTKRRARSRASLTRYGDIRDSHSRISLRSMRAAGAGQVIG